MTHSFPLRANASQYGSIDRLSMARLSQTLHDSQLLAFPTARTPPFDVCVSRSPNDDGMYSYANTPIDIASLTVRVSVLQAYSQLDTTMPFQGG